MRRLDIHLKAGDRFDNVLSAVKASEPVDYYILDTEQKDRRLISVFIREGVEQVLMDNVQSALEGSNGWRISILPIEATAPKLEEATEGKQAKSQQATREEIYSDVKTGARLDRNFIVMVIRSNQGMSNFVKQGVENLCTRSHFTVGMRERNTFFVKMTASGPLFGTVEKKHPAFRQKPMFGQFL